MAVQRVEIPEHALYQGDVSGMICPIYRYAVTRVTGQLQLHGARHGYPLGRRHDHSDTRPYPGSRLADYIADRGLVSRDDLVTAGLSDETDEMP